MLESVEDDSDGPGSVESVFERMAETAYDARDAPVIAYADADVGPTEDVWTADADTDARCVAITESGLAGYFGNTRTLLEYRDGTLIRTSVDAGPLAESLLDVFAYGFHTVVRHRIVTAGTTSE